MSLDLPSGAKSLSSRLNACRNGIGSAVGGGGRTVTRKGSECGGGPTWVHEVSPTSNAAFNGNADSTAARSHWKPGDVEDGHGVGDVPKVHFLRASL